LTENGQVTRFVPTLRRGCREFGNGTATRADPARIARAASGPLRAQKVVNMNAPGFLSEYATDVVLRDGTTLHLRPVRPDDDAKLLDLFQRMSEQSLY
jgi:hypothetical protein